MQRIQAAMLRAAAALGLAALAGCAAPGAVIRGTLRVPTPAARSTTSGGHAPRAAVERRPDLSEAVVYVERIPAPAGKRSPPAPPAPARARLYSEPDRFEPRVVAVARGDSVVFENRDRRWHNAFSVSAARPFDLGTIRPGGARGVQFDHTGAVRVFCRLHADSSALVFVTPNPGWAHPDASGTFALPALPPGRYELKAWHPRYGERRWRVDLPRRGVALELVL